MREFVRRFWFALHRAELERDLEEEMRHHLALGAEERGSAQAAMRQFGNVTLLKERSRAMWTWTFWEQLQQDVRYGLRAMAANPLFTAMAVLSLALGIGANTAIYSFMDAILLRSLPVQHPEQLVVVNWRAKDHPTVIHGQNGSRHRDGGRNDQPQLSLRCFSVAALESRNHSAPCLPMLRRGKSTWWRRIRPKLPTGSSSRAGFITDSACRPPPGA